MNNEDKVVLFDGVCNFCQASVQFIIKHDKSNSLKFASLQSDIGKTLIAQYNIPATVDSIVFIKDNKAFIKSDAALEIAGFFEFPFYILKYFNIVPVAIRNFVYDIIARNRYNWFGKQDACMLPSPEVSARFLDAK